MSMRSAATMSSRESEFCGSTGGWLFVSPTGLPHVSRIARTAKPCPSS
ncbi:MAG: hypothetical protein V9G10_14360 [Candidatus Nanopelagicales bacterium]